MHTFFSSCFEGSSGDPVTVRRELSLADCKDLVDFSLTILDFVAVVVVVAVETAEPTRVEAGTFTGGIEKIVAK